MCSDRFEGIDVKAKAMTAKAKTCLLRTRTWSLVQNIAGTAALQHHSVYDHEFVIALYIAYDHASQLERA